MSSTDIQLYANNAKSALLLAIGTTDTNFSVTAGQGSKFPQITDPKQFFLVTLESASIVEVCKVITVIGDSFTVVRAQEGTSATAFPGGAVVQMRVTRDTLARFARLTDRLGDISTVDQLPLITSATGNSFICQSYDDAGNPIIAVKAADRWRYPTHSVVVVNSTVVSSTTSSITAPALLSLPVATGRHIINFLTGSLAGTSRLATGISGTTVSWATAYATPPEAGTQFEILVSNAYQISLLSALSDDSIINAIIFGS